MRIFSQCHHYFIIYITHFIRKFPCTRFILWGHWPVLHIPYFLTASCFAIDTYTDAYNAIKQGSQEKHCTSLLRSKGYCWQNNFVVPRLYSIEFPTAITHYVFRVEEFLLTLVYTVFRAVFYILYVINIIIV